MAEAVVRPLSLAGTVLGGAMYVITWPFAKLGKADTAEAKGIYWTNLTKQPSSGRSAISSA